MFMKTNKCIAAFLTAIILCAGQAEVAFAAVGPRCDTPLMAEESEAALEEVVNRVEPALVLVCSVLVGMILLSVMLPLMHIISAVG